MATIDQLQPGYGSNGPQSVEYKAGKVLVSNGFLNQEQLDQAHKISTESDESLLDTMVSEDMVAQETIETVLNIMLRIPAVNLKKERINPLVVDLVPEEYVREHMAVPLGSDINNYLRVATRSYNDSQLLSDLESMTGLDVRLYYPIGRKIEDFIDENYG
ncbi:MAG: hypothetical protein IH934_05245 [Nanoarchaeota archaeon]|nr:hypothetical protein [Nanoarchaeota archaeon]